MIVALAGGVGGSKLARGLAAELPAGELLVVVNTGDDFEHLGLAISPDLDTVTYALAGCANREHGWGIEGDSWSFMDALARIGGETWFRLGDRDLATHVERSRRLRGGESLTDVTADFCRRLGIVHRIAPMSDDRVSTVVGTERDGVLAFQDYFVRRRCEPVVTALAYEGASSARPSAPFAAALAGEDVEAVVVCPSNPLLSIAPILALSGVKDSLATLDVPRIAVSPIVAGHAIKGPAAKMMRELGHEPSAATVADLYGSVVDGFVVDARDGFDGARIGRCGAVARVADTLMGSPADERRVARTVLDFARDLAAARR